MKVATWNLERGGRTAKARAAQEAVLRELGADVVALTEPPSRYRDGSGVVASEPRRPGSAGLESWAAVIGPSVEALPFEIPYDRMAVAARAVVANTRVIIYCAVLPWLAVASHAPDVVRAGEDSLGVFKRVLAEQIRDVTELGKRFGDIVVWAGDFNQTVVGTTRGGSNARRRLLLEALSALGYAAWNGAAAHATAGMSSVDLICGPRDRAVVGQGRIDPTRGGVVMSDHAGYWVDI